MYKDGSDFSYFVMLEIPSRKQDVVWPPKEAQTAAVQTELLTFCCAKTHVVCRLVEVGVVEQTTRASLVLLLRSVINQQSKQGTVFGQQFGLSAVLFASRRKN